MNLISLASQGSPRHLFYCSITILQYCNTAIRNVETLKIYNNTILQYHNIAILQYWSIATMQYYGITILQLIVQCCSITKLRYCNITMLHFTTLHFYNITGTILRHCNITASQNQDIKIIWYYNTIITIFHSFNISILQLCNITMIIIDFSRHLPRPSSNPPSLKASCGLGGMREA